MDVPRGETSILRSQSMSYTSGSHTVFHHRYHIAWITKLRRQRLFRKPSHMYLAQGRRHKSLASAARSLQPLFESNQARNQMWLNGSLRTILAAGWLALLGG